MPCHPRRPCRHVGGGSGNAASGVLPPTPGLPPLLQAVPRAPPHLRPPRRPPGPPRPLPRLPRALAALPHALLLLHSLPAPATNDLNAALRGLATTPHPARSLLLLAGRLPSPPPPTRLPRRS
ncbi:Os06g0226066 [Oryza sativa Japonica Group]|uniref:Os06g0226066 protein n=1 Tax=Oryza sativa subsp. japonica TaxID=39947 RepID=A0A0P0WUN9_ORYSJ|nr:Os06g0226066 [Oryza sativa Japonica Group]